MSVGEKTEKLIRSAWQDHPSEEWRNAYLCGLLDGVLLGQEVLQVDKVAGIQENCCVVLSRGDLLSTRARDLVRPVIPGE